MKRKDLNELYKKVAKEVGFEEDKSQKGWMPKLGPNDYKSKIVHGFTDKGPVTLTVGPYELVDFEAARLAGSYSLAEKKNEPCIVLPKVWDIGHFDGRSWVVRERVGGRNPLSGLMTSVGLKYVVQLYWNTVAVFSEMEEQSQVSGDSGDFENFMRNRLEKWVGLGKSPKNRKLKQKLEVFKAIGDDVFRYVFYETDLGESVDLEMQLFFKNFGNTDIVLQNNKFYLPSSEIITLPQFYGAAYFVWNILMHSYKRYDSSIPSVFIYEGVVEEIESWREQFYSLCPDDLKDKFHTAFYLLLFERVIATLLVDIPLRRSPFDVNRINQQEGAEEDVGAKRAQKAEKIFVEVLKYLLNVIPTLIKNEPFEESFAALEKTYFH